MNRKPLFICDLIQRREMGFLHRDERQQFLNAGLRLSDKLLVHDNVIKVNKMNLICEKFNYKIHCVYLFLHFYKIINAIKRWYAMCCGSCVLMLQFVMHFIKIFIENFK